jgi:multimeric flavodoxin WrbA
MAVIGILGSPRIGGNSDILLEEAMRGVRDIGLEVEKIVLSEMDIRPCRECDGCRDTGICIVEDDMQEVYRLLIDADGVILASPIFFGGVTAQTKAMVDRCQCLWVAKHLLKLQVVRKPGRPGLFIAVGSMGRQSHFQCAGTTAKAFFATIDTEYSEIGYLGIEGKGDILKHPTALKDSYNEGRRIAVAITGLSRG